MTLRGLYAITPEHTHDRDTLRDQVHAAILGGAQLVQYRPKSADAHGRASTAKALLALCRGHGIPLIVNDDVELAAAIGADGVHLGKDDPSPLAARERLGADAIIGISCYNELARAEQARALGADYVAFGRFFPSASKPHAVPAQIDLLRRARARIGLPIVAIGGISPQNGGLLIQAGADMLAVIDALFGRTDIRAAAEEFTQLFAPEEPR